MIDMERKIGEIFEYNGEWYQCAESEQDACTNCAFNPINGIGYNCSGSCAYKQVIFKKLEKVGEPYVADSKCCQQYQCYTTPLHNRDIIYTFSDNRVVLEIKNKEDMKEKNKAEGLPLLRLVGKYMNSLIDYATFEKAVKDLYSNKEESKPTLKEFDLEAAKKGKPVCTRGGHKARIICFDLKNDEYPIVAAVGNDSSETLFSYTTNGEIADGIESDKDLMMLTEKRSGWVNIYKSDRPHISSEICDIITGVSVFETKEGAISYIDKDKEYITTVKI